MFTIQTLIAVGVVVGVAVAWTLAFVVASAIWKRDEVAREARILSQPAAPAEDTRELVLR
jgi:hypothetical protein